MFQEVWYICTAFPPAASFAHRQPSLPDSRQGHKATLRVSKGQLAVMPSLLSAFRWDCKPRSTQDLFSDLWHTNTVKTESFSKEAKQKPAHGERQTEEHQEIRGCCSLPQVKTQILPNTHRQKGTGNSGEITGQF